MQELQQRLQRVIDTWGPNGARPSETNCKEEMAKIRKDIVNFHGEMVLLVNYSNVNYTGNPFNWRSYYYLNHNIRILNLKGNSSCFINMIEFSVGLAKILKKYDKRTGGLLRLLFIQKVLKQPFFTTEVVSKLIKECESTIAQVFPVEEKEREKGESIIRVSGEGIFRNTVAALLTMQEIRSGSSTQSQFSLPPLNLTDSEFIRTLKMNSPPIPIPILW